MDAVVVFIVNGEATSRASVRSTNRGPLPSGRAATTEDRNHVADGASLRLSASFGSPANSDSRIVWSPGASFQAGVHFIHGHLGL